MNALGDESVGGNLVVKVDRPTLCGFYDHFGDFVPIDHGHFTPSAQLAAKGLRYRPSTGIAAADLPPPGVEPPARFLHHAAVVNAQRNLRRHGGSNS